MGGRRRGVQGGLNTAGFNVRFVLFRVVPAFAVTKMKHMKNARKSLGHVANQPGKVASGTLW